MISGRKGEGHKTVSQSPDISDGERVTWRREGDVCPETGKGNNTQNVYKKYSS